MGCAGRFVGRMPAAAAACMTRGITRRSAERVTAEQVPTAVSSQAIGLKPAAMHELSRFHAGTTIRRSHFCLESTLAMWCASVKAVPL